MVERARVLAAALAILAVGSACTGPDAPRPHTETDTCRLRPAGSRSGDVPMAVDGVVPDDVWVVGSHYVGGAGVPYARRWDGERWEPTPVELITAGNAGFHDVVAISRDEAWAVGSLRGSEVMAHRWDGSSWSSAPIRAFGAVQAELFGVAAADRTVWAVGRADAGAGWRTLVMRVDRGSWAAVDAPTPDGVDAALRGVDAAGPDDVWAVGWTAGRRGVLRTLALRYDGAEWQRVPTPNPGEGDHLLSAVAAVGRREAWAVGWSIGADGRDRPLILRWNGSRWRPVPAPAFEGRAQLVDVSAPSTGDVWAAGRVTDASETFASLVLRRTEGGWSRVPLADVGEEDDTLAGIAVVDGFPWAVGTSVSLDGQYSSLTLSGC